MIETDRAVALFEEAFTWPARALDTRHLLLENIRRSIAEMELDLDPIPNLRKYSADGCGIPLNGIGQFR